MAVFSVEVDQDDVELLMSAVSTALRQWESGTEVGFSTTQMKRGQEEALPRARQLSFQARVNRNEIIHSTRPRIGPLVIRFQLLVRRLTWWFTEPILQQIASFQINTARVVQMLAEDQTVLRSEVDAVRDAVGDDSARRQSDARLEELETEVKKLLAERDA